MNAADQARLTEALALALRPLLRSNRVMVLPAQLRAGLVAVVAALAAHLADGEASHAERAGDTCFSLGLSSRSLITLCRIVERHLADTGHRAAAEAFCEGLAERAWRRAEEAIVQQQEQFRAALDHALQQHAIAVSEQELLRHTLEELSTPIAPVYAGVLAVPLIGAIDTRRAQEIADRLLSTISEQHVDTVLVDIGGIPVADTAVIQHLLNLANAARLLGALVVLVGVRPEIAQTIVSLGVDLGALATRATLREGLSLALSRQGLVIAPSAADQPGTPPSSPRRRSAV